MKHIKSTMIGAGGAKQIVDLTRMMLDHSYDETAVRAILGEGWARVCGAVWK